MGGNKSLGGEQRARQLTFQKVSQYIGFQVSWDRKGTNPFPLPSSGKAPPILGLWGEHKLAFSKFNIPNFFFLHFSTIHLMVIFMKSRALLAFLQCTPCLF